MAYHEIKDKPEDIAEINRICARANYSVSILGISFVYRGSGHFLNIRSPCEVPRRANAKHIDDTV